ncbi:Protein rolling stone [Folsomia candida]|uniref:Protein rolling stone n=1 Tax=Folsomia candida TaxID=158441 RepID=A0A226DRM0_FOLCA|nr:Protein rolling stone [Folsomia candida]
MGRRPSIAWLIWVRNFGFTSKRKYGFLHSTWEVIIARRTGTTYSVLDYVVYRLFYVLTLCGASVYKLSQVNPLPFLIYFETWALFAHTIYSFLFLPEINLQLFSDEIERNGHKYYISKKISVLPRDNLSAYEKLVWVMFDISATMSFVSLAVTAGTPPFLVRRHPKGKPYPPKFDHFVLVTLGFIMTLVDIVVNTLPMRIGHFIYSILFCLLYFLMAYEFHKIIKKLHAQFHTIPEFYPCYPVSNFFISSFS